MQYISRVALFDNEGEMEGRITTVRADNMPRTKRQMRKALEQEGFIEYGCCCAHCLNDWDCCGNYFVITAEVLSVSRRTGLVRYHESISRNV